MTLQEFITTNDSKGFVKEKSAAMRFHVELCKQYMKDGSYMKFKTHFETVNQNYYAIYGYIMAAYEYGRISFEESCSLLDEVMESSKPKM